MQTAINEAISNNKILNKSNFSDNYNIILISFSIVPDDDIKTIWLAAQYRKVDTWYKRSIRFGFTTNTIKEQSDDVFILNGTVDAVIFNDDIFVLQETSFEKIFNYFEKSKQIVVSKKDEITNWSFIDRPSDFYDSANSTKGTITKLARALEKSSVDFSKLSPSVVKKTLSKYDEFKSLTYDKDNKIIFKKENRDLIIGILWAAYTRSLFSDDLVHTKGI